MAISPAKERSRPPRGFSVDTAHIEYIKHKSFIVWTESQVKGMDGPQVVRQVAAGFKLALPLVKWLREAVRA